MISIEQLYRLFLLHPCVTTDSRNCPAGSIFIALKGERFNGNAFAAAAIEKGCSYAVVDEPQYATSERILLVEDALRSMQELAAYHRRQLASIPVICITGTNGKTTTKELTAAVLSKKYNVLYTQGNLNNSIGTPLTVLQLTKEHDIAVIEVGASHPGDIKELVDIAQPDYGIITNVGRAHLEGFGSFEGVVRTKGELYDYLREHGGKALINKGNPHLCGISSGLQLIGYQCAGELTDEMTVAGEAMESAPLKLQWKDKEGSHIVKTHLIGGYNLENVLAAITAGKLFSVDNNDICKAIEGYIPSNHRSQLVKTSRNTLIVDAYNANPSSMNAALDNFMGGNGLKKAVILGSMKELGAYSEKEHESIMRRIADSDIILPIFIGEEFALLQNVVPNPRAFYFADTDACHKWMEAHPLDGLTILLKGSHSNHIETLTELL